ncbi:hypothetical protein [Sphingopyxis witflariensis]|nr:hypothetical protein [Sphingopyxis witflariensis]
MMTQAVKTPVHLWIVGVVSLLWNSIGISDYIGFKLKNAWYIAQTGFNAEQVAWFDALPLWANIGWALGVWGAFFGSVLLLMRSRHAVTVFLISLIGLVLHTAHQLLVAKAEFIALFGSGPLSFMAVIWIIAIALYLYARRQAAAGVLR